ncbi:MAG: class I mannose-6-phosphate isomerase [Muribaculaceae bacterium]|nr:class I mannose-6-phosphate isomerase [Muribaculaceae bacterium]
MYKFHPILKSVLWGGNRLASFKRLDTNQNFIGESWEISGIYGYESIVACGKDAGHTLPQLIAKYRDALVGEDVYSHYGNEFPLLVKLIDAAKDLSVQVHPDDEIASLRHGCMGKTEMWYVIDSQPGALIHAGFNSEISPEQYESMVKDGTIMHAVKSYESHSGDIFFLPPGTIHSIGAGNLIAEIQQSSDITYRIYDYDRRDAMGNKRPLHTDLARAAINFEDISSRAVDYDRGDKSKPSTIVSCPQFMVNKITVQGTMQWDVNDVHSFVIIMCIDGEAVITDDSALTSEDDCKMTLKRGDTILVPACASHISIYGSATLITAHIP